MFPISKVAESEELPTLSQFCCCYFLYLIVVGGWGIGVRGVGEISHNSEKERFPNPYLTTPILREKQEQPTHTNKHKHTHSQFVVEKHFLCIFSTDKYFWIVQKFTVAIHNLLLIFCFL